MTALGRFLTLHSVSVQTFLGTKGSKPSLAEAVAVPGFVEEDVTLSYASEGTVITVQGTKFYTAVENLPLFVAGSLVTLWPGQQGWRIARVMNVIRRDVGIAAVNHCEVNLT